MNKQSRHIDTEKSRVNQKGNSRGQAKWVKGINFMVMDGNQIWGIGML